MQHFFGVLTLGPGGGLMVCVLAFFSNDKSLNTAGFLNFLHEKTKINEKEAGFGPSLKKCANT